MTASIVTKHAPITGLLSGNATFDVALTGTGVNRTIFVVAQSTAGGAQTLNNLTLNSLSGEEIASYSSPTSAYANFSLYAFNESVHPGAGTFTFAPTWSAAAGCTYIVIETQDAAQAAPYINDIDPPTYSEDVETTSLTATLTDSTGLLGIFIAAAVDGSYFAATLSNISANLTGEQATDNTNETMWLSVSHDVSIASNSEVYTADFDNGRAGVPTDNVYAVAFAVNDVPINQPPSAEDDSFNIFTNAQVGDVVGTVPVSDSDGTVTSASITGTNFDIDTAGEITVISTSGLSVGTITEDATFTDNDGDSTVVTITINVTAPQLAISSVSSYSVAANANFTVSYNNADAAISAFITLNNTDYALTKVSDTNGVATFTAPFLPDFGDFTANFDTDLTVNITDGTTTTQFPQAFRVQKIAAATDTIGVITTPSPVGDYKDVVGDPTGATSYRQSLTGDSTGDIATGLYTVTQAASARYRLYDGVWGDWFTVNYPAPVEVVNQAPAASAQTFSIQDDAANNSQIGQFVATDSDGTIDGDGYSSSNPNVSITTGGMLLLADNSGLTAGTPLTGTISFRDNDGATGSANFTVNVTAAPVQATPPSARPDSPIPATLYVKVSEPYPLAQHVLNPDGAALSYAVAQNSPALPANVSLNASTGQLSTTDNSYTPVEDLEIEVLLA